MVSERSQSNDRAVCIKMPTQCSDCNASKKNMGPFYVIRLASSLMRFGGVSYKRVGCEGPCDPKNGGSSVLGVPDKRCGCGRPCDPKNGGSSVLENYPSSSLDPANDAEQTNTQKENIDDPEKALFGAVNTLVEFVCEKLAPASSKNLLHQIGTLQATSQDMTRQLHEETVTKLSDPYSSNVAPCKIDGTQNNHLEETSTSDEDSQCSDLEDMDLAFTSDDSQQSDYSPCEEEEEEEASSCLNIKRRVAGLESSKKLRLKAKFNMGVNDRFPHSQTKDFVKFLGSPAGGLKSNVKEVDSAVSRCLYYLDSRMLQWSNLLKLSRVSDWLGMHASFGDGPSALINKIYYIQAGLKYLRYLSTDDEHQQTKCSSALQELDTWRIRYRPLLRKRRCMIKDAMCKKDDEMISLKLYTDVVNDQGLQRKAWDIVNKGRSGFSVARDEFVYVVRYCLTMLVIKNAKRPGVLAGMKLQEWNSRNTCQDGLKLVLVRNHKTASSGSSHVYVEANDENLIMSYISYIRPFAQNSQKTGFVFINYAGTQLGNVSSQIRKIVPKGVKFSATKMRKVYSTCVGELGSYLKETQVAQLADHSPETQQRYYVAKRKQKQTAEAYQTLQNLRNDSIRESYLEDSSAKENPQS